MKILRRVAVPPISVISVFLANYLYRLGFVLSGDNPDSVLSRIVLGFLCGVTFVYSGVMAAPSSKKTTARVLGVIGIVLSVINMFIKFDIGSFFAIVGIIGIAFFVDDEGFMLG